jgi:Leucine Rich repeat
MELPQTIATVRSSQSLAQTAHGDFRVRSRRSELIRTAVVAALAVTLATLIVGGWLFVGTHLVAAWWLEKHQALIVWDIDKTNWRQGGATSVSIAAGRFSFSRITDADLDHLHRLHRVVSLNLAESDSITNKGLTALRGLDFLTELDLDRLNRYRYFRIGMRSAPLTDACLVHLRALPRVERLSLAGNLINDQGLSQIVGMTSLKTLDLSATEVGDAALTYLERMKSLKTVNLGATRVTKAGIAQLMLARPDLTIATDVDPAVAEGVKMLRGETQ